MMQSTALEKLIEALRCMPGIGRKSAQRIAYHLLEHDIHHRADIFHYLALLGIEHPQVETP